MTQMKTQNFGVEVEMNHITRYNAAKVAAKYFGTFRYEDTASRNGYYAWSAWDRQGREWKFQKDISIHGPDSEKCEMVTPILTYADIPALQQLVRELREAGAISNPNEGCGVHIHVDGTGHTAKSIRSLCNIMAKYEHTFAKTVYIPNNRMNSYCKMIDDHFLTILNAKRPTTLREVANIWYGTQASSERRNNHYNSSRYHALNLHSFFNGHGTIEFRLFQFDNPHKIRKNGNVTGYSNGGLHAGKLKAMIHMCLALCAYAKEVSPMQFDKQICTKAEMDQFMDVIGLTGDEFKVTRKYFERGLNDATARATANPRPVIPVQPTIPLTIAF